MLKTFPTVEEFQLNDFQRGYVMAMNEIVKIAKDMESNGATDDQIAARVQIHVMNAVYVYEPGHDKPSNAF